MNTTPEFLFPSANTSGGYRRRRVGSFAVSVVLHAAVIGAIAVLPKDWSLYVTPRPYQETQEESQPERFVLYYQAPELPPITPTKTARPERPVDPDVLAVQRMVSVPEVPTLNQTRVYLPEAPPQSQEKIEAENVIVVNPEPEPEPEPVRRVAPKAFTVPTPRKVERKVMETDVPVPQASALGPVLPSPTSALVNLPDAPPRPATAPEPSQQVSAAASTAQGTEVDAQAKASATVAVVSPSPASGRIPTSSAEADFRVGPPGPRDPAGKGLGSVEGAVTSVPNLAVSSARPPASSSGASPAAPPPPVRRPVAAPSRTSLSVALRAGSRRLPPSVEAVFGARDVYVYLLETRAEGRRGPDWTLWFADIAEPPPGRAPLFRPPVPMNPISVAGVLAPVATEGKTVHVRGVVRRSGRFEVAAEDEDESKNRIATLLRNTAFLPATRNGADTDVDIVIEVKGARAD